MRIVGHGIDIVSIERVGRQLAESRQDFLDGWFAEVEQKVWSAGSIKESQFVAGRVACKEAVAKALGTGFAGDVTWTDIRISNGEHGSPTVNLVEGARRVADGLSVRQWHVSISHTEEYAVASAIATADM